MAQEPDLFDSDIASASPVGSVGQGRRSSTAVSELCSYLQSTLGLFFQPESDMPWLAVPHPNLCWCASLSNAATSPHPACPRGAACSAAPALQYAGMQLQSCEKLPHGGCMLSAALRALEMHIGPAACTGGLSLLPLPSKHPHEALQRWRVVATFPSIFHPQHSAKLACLVTFMSSRLPLGHFTLREALQEGGGLLVEFRMPFVQQLGESQDGSAAADAVAAAAAVLERYAPAILACGLGALSPRVAVRMVEQLGADDTTPGAVGMEESHGQVATGLLTQQGAWSRVAGGMLPADLHRVLPPPPSPQAAGEGDPASGGECGGSAATHDAGGSQSDFDLPCPPPPLPPSPTALPAGGWPIPPGAAAVLNAAVLSPSVTVQMLSASGREGYQWSPAMGSTAARSFGAALSAAGIPFWRWDPGMRCVGARSSLPADTQLLLPHERLRDMDVSLDYTASAGVAGTRCLLRIEPVPDLVLGDTAPAGAIAVQEAFLPTVYRTVALLNASLHAGHVDVTVEDEGGAGPLLSLWLGLPITLPDTMPLLEAIELFQQLLKDALLVYTAALPALSQALAGMEMQPPSAQTHLVPTTPWRLAGVAAAALRHGFTPVAPPGVRHRPDSPPSTRYMWGSGSAGSSGGEFADPPPPIAGTSAHSCSG